MFFHFGQKFENSKWPPYVGRGNFLSTFFRHPVGRKLRQNRSISHGVAQDNDSPRLLTGGSVSCKGGGGVKYSDPPARL